MNKNIHVVVLMGGWSSEREVSLSSGKGVSEALRERGWTRVTELDMGRDVAARVAEENGAQLGECSVVAPENTSVDVTATIELPQPLPGLGPATGVSRAGPPAGEP